MSKYVQRAADLIEDGPRALKDIGRRLEREVTELSVIDLKRIESKRHEDVVFTEGTTHGRVWNRRAIVRKSGRGRTSRGKVFQKALVKRYGLGKELEGLGV